MKKNLWFATDFPPDFSNREELTRVLTTGYLHYTSNIGPIKALLVISRINLEINIIFKAKTG